MAIGSRSIEKAQKFVNEFVKGDKSVKTYGTYEEVYADKVSSVFTSRCAVLTIPEGCRCHIHWWEPLHLRYLNFSYRQAASDRYPPHVPLHERLGCLEGEEACPVRETCDVQLRRASLADRGCKGEQCLLHGGTVDTFPASDEKGERNH